MSEQFLYKERPIESLSHDELLGACKEYAAMAKLLYESLMEEGKQCSRYREALAKILFPTPTAGRAETQEK